MIVKAVEIRDKGTFIPALAILMRPDASPGCDKGETEFFLLRRAGYGFDNPLVLLSRMDANGTPRQASYDSFSWGCARTMGEAHRWIESHWDELQSGDVVDVEFILGETQEPKLSEQFTAPQ